MSLTISDGRALNPRSNSIYEFLAFTEPGLLLDVGAAAGGFTTLMGRRSPESRIIAFEPFPGNWPILDEAVAGIEQITVDRRAVSDSDGSARLFVGHVVTGDEKGWSDMIGYSSAGTLVEDDDPRFEKAFEVETIRLDSVVSDHVRFLKIDVQGAEMAVLHGAEGLLAKKMVDFMWVEFTGELEILECLHHHGFVAFDSQYLLIPRTEAPSEDEWDIVETKNLSNGRLAYCAWPHDYPRAPAAYCDWMRSKKADFVIQTDLAFVRREYLPRFLSAAGRALERVRAAL